MGSKQKRQRGPETRKSDSEGSGKGLAIIAVVAVVALLIVSRALPRKHSNADQQSGIATQKFESDSKIVSPRVEVATLDIPSRNLVSTPTNTASEHLNQGTKLFADGKLDEAIAQYERALKLSPDDEDAHYNLGVALARKGNRSAAEEQYREALRIYSDYSEAHMNLGNLLAAQGKLDE